MTAPLLLSVFPSFAIGGAQSRFTTLANYLGPSWRHAIVAMDGDTAARSRLHDSLDVTYPPVEIRKGDLLANVRHFRSLLRTLAPATLLTHNFGSIEWAIANRRQLVRHVHVEDGFGPEERRHQLPRRVWLRRIFLRGRPVVLPSRTLLDLARQTWRLDPRGLFYVPNGIDLDRFTDDGPRRTWPGEGPVIGTVAALRPEKNIARLIRATARVAAERPVRLVLVGDGAQRQELQRLSAELGLADRVHFEGQVADPSAILRSLDIFAMSSDTEQMPISLLEAMAACRAVAATDVGDTAAMLPPSARRFVTPCDDAALAAALATLAGDADLRREIGRACRATAERHFAQADMFCRWSLLLDGRLDEVRAAA